VQNTIVEKTELAPQTHRIRVRAPLIAEKRRAGQFVIVVADEHSERIPLTIVDADPGEGTVTLVFRAVGTSTMKLGELQEGDAIEDIAGPLGNPTHIEQFGTCVVLGGGYGIAPVVPIARALAEAGNEVIAINGARTAGEVILLEELGDICGRVEVCTDDGSRGHEGFVTEVLDDFLESEMEVDFVLAIGPTPMMRAVAEMTRPHEIPTMVSLNPIMIDGTGMCGGCRVEVGEETKFACVDGPEFDGHKVDFDLLMARQKMFDEHESEARAQYEHRCRAEDSLK
jgi:ferredoxin--NADP+ reductase